jgi:hypothetical protein
VLEQEKMSNWIDSGGHAPRQSSDAYLRTKRTKAGQSSHSASRWKAPVRVSCAVLSVALVSSLGHARDRGQYANSSPELKAWFDSLRSGKGPCCSDADGTAISDADWESKNGHYRVRIPNNTGEMEWIDVPDEAVITEPNRIGRTMVWPIRGYLGMTIRCFMPGSMT